MAVKANWVNGDIVTPAAMNDVGTQLNQVISDAAGMSAVNGANIASAVHAATSKATPVDADELGGVNSSGLGLMRITIANLREWIQDWLATFLVQGSGVTLTYSDASNTLTVSATGGGGLDAEAVRDTIAAALVGSGVVSVVPNDAGDTITITSSATANAADAELRDRSTHTGYQVAATISDFDSAADARVAAGIAGKLDTSAAPELIRDTIGTALVQGSGVTITPNDASDTITISVTGGGYTPGGADVALADGGTGASLADPNADRIMFFDDSAGVVTWLTPGTNLSITGTTINATAGTDASHQIVAAATGVAATDTAAIQAAHDSLPSTGGIIELQPGYYSLTAAGITLSKTVILQGRGMGDGSASGGTILLSNSTSATGITLAPGSGGSRLQDLLIHNQASGPTSGTGILVNDGDTVELDRVWVGNFYDAIGITDGIGWTIDTCVINSPRRYGVRVQNTTHPDFGDSTIINTKFLMDSSLPVADPAAAIRWETGGGLRVSHCKVNWASPTSYRYAVGVDVAFTGDIASTADIFIHHNSFENIRGTGVKLSRTVGTNTVTGVEISSNEFMNVPTCVDVASAGFELVSVHDNTGIGATVVTGVNVNAAASRPLVYANVWDPAVATKIGGSYTTPWTPRSTTITSSSTPTINTDSCDVYGLTALAVDATISVSGTPTDGQRLLVFIVPTATRALTWSSAFEGPMPVKAYGTARLDVDLVFNAVTSKWRWTHPVRQSVDLASSATPAVDLSIYQEARIASLSTNLTSFSSGLTGTANLKDGDPFVVWVKDNGTARTITLGATWVGLGSALPTTTVAGKWLGIPARWRASDSKLVVPTFSQET